MKPEIIQWAEEHLDSLSEEDRKKAYRCFGYANTIIGGFHSRKEFVDVVAVGLLQDPPVIVHWSQIGTITTEPYKPGLEWILAAFYHQGGPR